MADPVEPTPALVQEALDAMVWFAQSRVETHRLSVDAYPHMPEVSAGQEQRARAFTAAASLVRGLKPGDLLHEWQCPSCGATTRARMADYPGGGR